MGTSVISAPQSRSVASARKIPIDEIAGRPHPFVAERGSRSPSAADAGKAFLFHQPCDAFAADTDAGLLELGVDARGAVALPRRLVDRADAGREVGIAARPLAGLSIPPGVQLLGVDVVPPRHLGERDALVLGFDQNQELLLLAPPPPTLSPRQDLDPTHPTPSFRNNLPNYFRKLNQIANVTNARSPDAYEG